MPAPIAPADEILISGLHARAANWDTWLKQVSPDEGRALIDMAAMFSFRGEIHLPLQAVAEGTSNTRAFAVNAMPVNVAQALIRRAWLGQEPPRRIVFRDQSWPDAASIVTRVHDEVALALQCDKNEAVWLVSHIKAPLILIFATRPLPSAAFVSELLAALPYAILFFLMGSKQPLDDLPPQIAVLPPLPPNTDYEFLRVYKSLMEKVAPRTSAAKSATTRRGSANSASPRPSARKTARASRGGRTKRLRKARRKK